METLNSSISIFAWGALAVALVEMFKLGNGLLGPRWHQTRQRYGRMSYWVGLLILMAASGLVCVVTLSGTEARILTVIQVGINAPAIVSAWATSRAGRRSRTIQSKPKGIIVTEGDEAGLPEQSPLASWADQLSDDQTL